MIPTKRIDETDFKKLVAETGEETVPTYRITAMEFLPPLKEGEPQPNYGKLKSVRMMVLNVLEPSIYVDPKTTPYVIFPIGMELTYEQCDDIHGNKAAWCYRVAPTGWSESDHSDDLGWAEYIFAEEALTPYDREDEGTH